MKGVLVFGELRKCIVLNYYSHCNMLYENKYVFNRYQIPRKAIFLMVLEHQGMLTYTGIKQEFFS